MVTEKSMSFKDSENKVVFEVHPKANKKEIKDSVEKLFNVKVLAVNTMNVSGKKRRMGRMIGRRKNWKKAVVSLAPGHRIELFEGF
jgi:large subunit ribosomal protein L23